MSDSKKEKKVKIPLSPIQKYLQHHVKYGEYLKRLKELGLPYSKLQFECMRDGRPSKASYVEPDDNGNIRFYTPGFDGGIETYTNNAKNAKEHDWYLTRYTDPAHVKKYGKYNPVRGGGTRLLITPDIPKAYKAKKEVHTVYLVEGFFKALAMWGHGGLYAIGMNGRYGFKQPNKNRLHPDFRAFLQICQVKRVVIVFDSDLFDLSKSKEKAETVRPNDFYRSALTAKSLIEQFCDVVLVHPTPDPLKKFGFDDLLYDQRETEIKNDDLTKAEISTDKGHERVFKAFDKILQGDRTDMFQSLKLSSSVDWKIREYFHLGDVMDFYTYYKEELKDRGRFKYYTQLYDVKKDGTLEEVKEEELYGFFAKDGGLYKAKKKGEKPVMICNFTLKVLFHIKGDDTKRVVELTNYLNHKAVIEVTSSDFNNPQKFNSICMDEGDFIFKGGKDELLDICSVLFKHVKPAVSFPRLGFQPRYKVFAFANGIVTPDGWRECNENGIVDYNDIFFYFPAYSKFNEGKDDNFEEERKYSHFQPDKVYSFNDWKKQFSIVYGDNGEIAAAFYLSTLFSDVVFNHKASGIGFPLLWSAGKPKTGKSTICSSLLNLFGEGIVGDSLSGSSTIKYKNARFSQICNGPVHLDEYSANDKRTQDFLKNIYDRLGYGTKTFTNDAKTRINPILATALISGEVFPTDNHALFTRALLMTFNKTEDQRTETERDNFRKLSLMEETGLTTITVEILMHRHLVEKHFDDAYKQTIKDINTQLGTAIIDGRMKKNAAGVLAVSKVLIEQGVIDFSIAWKDLSNKR